ncbi:hypothetical protein STENM223S_04234 [Streptomyces tendae]
MSRARGKGPQPERDARRRKRDLAAEAFAEGLRIMRPTRRWPPWTSTCAAARTAARAPRRPGARQLDAVLRVHPDRTADPETWAWASRTPSCTSASATSPPPRAHQPDACELAARCVVVDRFLLGWPVGKAPEELPTAYPDGDEERLAAAWRRTGVPDAYRHCGTAGGDPDLYLTRWNGWYGQPPDQPAGVRLRLTRTVAAAMDVGRPP